MHKVLISIVTCMALLLMSALCFFSAVRYLEKDEIPEKVFFVVCGIMCIAVAIITTIGIMSA